MKRHAKIVYHKNGSIIQEPETIANVFNDYYAGIAQKILEDNPLSITNEVNVNTVKYFNSGRMHPVASVKYNRNSMFLTPTTEEEVVYLIKGLDNKKSTGVDEIPDYVIKKCHSKIKTALTHIINLSLSTGQFPDLMKIAKVKPLYRVRQAV
jgi:hypothetical protein